MNKPLTNERGEVRELTRADFKTMRPAREALGKEFVEAWEQSRREGNVQLREVSDAEHAKRIGRPAGTGKKQVVSLSLDRTLVERLRASGPGWQTRANNALSRWMEREDRKSGTSSS